MSLEQSLGTNGEYLALHGEIVEYDIYHLRDKQDVVSCNDPSYVHLKGHSGIDFVPDTVLDLGGNVGIFSRYAQSLWPKARIIAVEPNPVNCEFFRANTVWVTLLEAGIGSGDLYHIQGASNGAMNVYVSKSIGYPSFKDLESIGAVKKVSVRSLMLTDLKPYITGKVLLKLDIEGNETVIFNDPPSMELMRTFDYIVIELHYFADNGGNLEAVKAQTFAALDSLKDTHNTRTEHVYFYARKK